MEDTLLTVTVLGWFVTATVQIWILSKQKDLEKDIESFKLMAPRRIAQLEEVAEWASAGNRITHDYENALIEIEESETEPEKASYKLIAEKAKQDFIKWERQTGKLTTYASAVWDKLWGGNLYNHIAEFSNAVNPIFHSSAADHLATMAANSNDPEIGHPDADYLFSQNVYTKHYDLIFEIDKYITNSLSTNEEK